MKGRKYILHFPAVEKVICWKMLENQLFKIADDIEKICSVPVTIKLKNYNSSASEVIIKHGVIFKNWEMNNQ